MSTTTMSRRERRAKEWDSIDTRRANVIARLTAYLNVCQSKEFAHMLDIYIGKLETLDRVSGLTKWRMFISNAESIASGLDV